MPDSGNSQGLCLKVVTEKLYIFQLWMGTI